MRTALLAAIAATVLCAGCGSPRGPLLSGGEDPIRGGSAGFVSYSPPVGLVNCLRAGGVPAARINRSAVLVSSPADRSIVDFEALDEAAQARQLRGLAQGAELIGSGLFFLGRAGEARISQVQDCLG